MATVFFDNKFVKLVSIFCEDRNPVTGRPIFSNNLKFMVFAAMIGRHFHDSCRDVNVDRSNKEIKDGTFNSTGQDGYAFLLALDAEKDGEVFRSGRENELYKYIESYAFLGCQEIEKWMADNQWQDHPYEVILSKMMEAAESLIEQQSENSKVIDIDLGS